MDKPGFCLEKCGPFAQPSSPDRSDAHLIPTCVGVRVCACACVCVCVCVSMSCVTTAEKPAPQLRAWRRFVDTKNATVPPRCGGGRSIKVLLKWHFAAVKLWPKLLSTRNGTKATLGSYPTAKHESPAAERFMCPDPGPATYSQFENKQHFYLSSHKAGPQIEDLAEYLSGL